MSWITRALPIVLILESTSMGRAVGDPRAFPARLVAARTRCLNGDARSCVTTAGYFSGVEALGGQCPSLYAEYRARACDLGDKASCKAALLKQLDSSIRALESNNLPARYEDEAGVVHDGLTREDRENAYGANRSAVDELTELRSAVRAKRPAPSACGVGLRVSDTDPLTVNPEPARLNPRAAMRDALRHTSQPDGGTL